MYACVYVIYTHWWISRTWWIRDAIDAIRNAGMSRAFHRFFYACLATVQFHSIRFFFLFTGRLISFFLPSFFRIVLHESRRGFCLAVSYCLFFSYLLCATWYMFLLFYPLDTSFRKAESRLFRLPTIILPLNCTDTSHVISFCRNYTILVEKNYRFMFINVAVYSFIFFLLFNLYSQ